MPRLRMTEQQRRERALLGAVGRGKACAGLNTDKAVAEAISVAPCTYSRLKAGAFQGMDLGKFGQLARTLGLTGREVCEAVGVPYHE